MTRILNLISVCKFKLNRERAINYKFTYRVKEGKEKLENKRQISIELEVDAPF